MQRGRALAQYLLDTPLDRLVARAAALRDEGHGSVVTYSPKVFIPLTQLCRDVCHYCTFAQTPKRTKSAYLSPELVLEIARAGAKAGCHEALFTIGDRPEARYSAARDALAALGFDTTADYLRSVAELVIAETGLLPHINAGVLDARELALLRPVAGSMGLMLESSSERLCQRGGPHFGSPDKLPAARIATLRLAGLANIPFTTGLLIGIGETRAERIETLLTIAALHAESGHIQEVIVQNFRAKPGTRMASHPEPSLDDLRWTIAAARIVLGPHMSIQAPPNLSAAEALPALVDAGINDWGGVSPVTRDHVNPEAAWPDRATLALATEHAGKTLVPRLTIYPAFAQAPDRWVDAKMAPHVRRRMDMAGLAREDGWYAGAAGAIPAPANRGSASRNIREIIGFALEGECPGIEETVTLLDARGSDVDEICAAADALRRERRGDDVTYVINRNINYTNICSYRCGFCAFSKGRANEGLRDRPYLMDMEEIASRTQEAAALGATEVCMQGGIHPSFTGNTYIAICQAARQAAPGIHIHAFSPLEVRHGAQTLGLSVGDFLLLLKAAGLNSLPGTAAEILDDEVRAVICPDKLTTDEWIETVETAHAVGLRTTATIMFGHVETGRHVARHLHRVLDLQNRTGGITEFVPLPFVHMEAPISLRGNSRRGPTWREVRLVHAVSRLLFDRSIPNIQASWVKLGIDGVAAALDFGVNDVGGTLMNESITRAAGTTHGSILEVADLKRAVQSKARTLRQRSTLYQLV